MGPPTDAVVRDDKSQSPNHRSNTSSPPQDAATDAKRDPSPVKADNKPNPVEPPKLPALPPRPPSTSKSPERFEKPPVPSLSLEPNPFEQSFGGAPSGPTTPGGTKLPPVAALTSPSSLLPGGTPFWGGSLRTGPLSPAMLSGPTDYFSDTHHIRSFPTPNESSIRTTGLTPGGSGSMFPPAAPSPGSLFSLGGPAPTPGVLDFHRTALSAAAAKREQAQAAQQQQPPTSVPPPPQSSLGSGDGLSKNVDPHDNDAANGLFMLAQGRPSVQPPPPSNYPAGPLVDGLAPSSTAPQTQTLPAPSQLNGTSSLPGPNEANAAAAEPETARPSTRGKKRSISGATGGSRRKAEETPKEPPNKKGRANGGAAISSASSDDRHSADEQQQNGGGKEQANTGSSSKSKMTDEEKRKNFLERNRVAALKCRQRKKQWLASLQQKVETYSQENESLLSEIEALRGEIVSLKAALLQHKNCSVSQQQRQQQQEQQQQASGATPAFLQQQAATLDYNPPLDPYAMAGANPLGPQPGMGQPLVPPRQAVAAGQGINRRFS